jgi:hypothetical protein
MQTAIRADEGGDGLTGNYDTRISANGQHVAIQAAVTFPGRNAGGKMNQTVGSASVTKEIPSGTSLLAAASQAMLDRLAAGQTDFTLKVIEPTAPDGAADLHVVVLADSPFGATALPADTNGALKGKSWFIRMTKKQGNGAQDTLLQLFESGVVARILADISGIRFEMTARNINVFPKPSCRSALGLQAQQLH